MTFRLHILIWVLSFTGSTSAFASIQDALIAYENGQESGIYCSLLAKESENPDHLDAQFFWSKMCVQGEVKTYKLPNGRTVTLEDISATAQDVDQENLLTREWKGLLALKQWRTWAYENRNPSRWGSRVYSQGARHITHIMRLAESGRFGYVSYRVGEYFLEHKDLHARLFKNILEYLKTPVPAHPWLGFSKDREYNPDNSSLSSYWAALFYFKAIEAGYLNAIPRINAILESDYQIEDQVKTQQIMQHLVILGTQYKQAEEADSKELYFLSRFGALQLMIQTRGASTSTSGIPLSFFENASRALMERGAWRGQVRAQSLVSDQLLIQLPQGSSSDSPLFWLAQLALKRNDLAIGRLIGYYRKHANHTPHAIKEIVALVKKSISDPGRRSEHEALFAEMLASGNEEVPQNIPDAYRRLKKLEVEGHVWGTLALSRFLYDHHHYRESWEILTQFQQKQSIAFITNPYFDIIYALHLMNSTEIARDPDRAVMLLKQAYQKGNTPSAAFYLARYRFKNQISEKDLSDTEMLGILMGLASSNDPLVPRDVRDEIHRMLGTTYLDGLYGMPINIKQGRAHLDQAGDYDYLKAPSQRRAPILVENPYFDHEEP
jgi:hypothetical protein